MTQYVLNALGGMGIGGVFLAMALEGSSVPFPGALVVLAFGYLLHPSIPEMLVIAFGMSLTYSIFSYIAYGIGIKLEAQIAKRYEQHIRKAQYWFRKYGEWSVALLRPFGVGNYVSYFAGMSRVKPVKYGILTFLGIYPWSFVMLLLGRTYRGSAAAIAQAFRTHQNEILFGVVVLVIAATIFLSRREPVRLESTGESEL